MIEPPGPTLRERYETYERRVGHSPNTILLYRRRFDTYEREVGPIEDMTTEGVQQWLDDRKLPNGKPISDKTRSGYLTTFSAFFKWALKFDLVPVDPIAKIDRPKIHNGMPDPIPERSLRRALRECKSPILKCWIVFEAYGGLRCQEVAYLRHEDIQLDVRYTKKGNVKSYGRVFVEHGKGGKQRYVPLLAPMIDALAEYTPPEDTGRLWPSAKPSTVSQRINRYYHSLGITHTAHKNRHRAGTQMYRASGESLLVVQAFLGHSDPKTSAIYSRIDDESMTTAAMLIT